MTKVSRKALVLLLVLTLIGCAFTGVDEASATAKYTALTVPAVSDGGWYELGMIVIEVPALALSAGDTVILGLPDNFKYIDNYQNPPAVGANEYTFEGDAQGRLVVKAPERYEGNSNVLYDTGGEGIEFAVDLLGENQMRITLMPALDVANESGGYLLIEFDEIYIDSGFGGDIKLSIEAPPGSAFAVSNTPPPVGNVPQEEEEEEEETPPPIQPSISATFIIDSSTYQVNGTSHIMDVVPYIKDGFTYIPFRYAAYALGVSEQDVVWDEINKTATLAKGDKVVEVKIGSTNMLVNGTSTALDVAPEINDDRTMLPMRFIAQAFSAAISWEESTRTVKIKL